MQNSSVSAKGAQKHAHSLSRSYKEVGSEEQHPPIHCACPEHHEERKTMADEPTLDEALKFENKGSSETSTSSSHSAVSVPFNLHLGPSVKRKSCLVLVHAGSIKLKQLPRLEGLPNSGPQTGGNKLGPFQWDAFGPWGYPGWGYKVCSG